jgi:hypothetical protein
MKHAVNIDGYHVINSVDDINTSGYDGVRMYECFEFCPERTFFAHTYGDFSTGGDVKVGRISTYAKCRRGD